MYKNVHSNSVYNSKNLETVQMTNLKWADTWIVVYLFSRMWHNTVRNANGTRTTLIYKFHVQKIHIVSSCIKFKNIILKYEYKYPEKKAKWLESTLPLVSRHGHTWALRVGPKATLLICMHYFKTKVKNNFESEEEVRKQRLREGPYWAMWVPNGDVETVVRSHRWDQGCVCVFWLVFMNQT